MKAIVWMTREIWRTLSQYAVDCPTLPVNQRYFHLVVILERRLLSRSDKPPDIWNTRRVYRETFFANPPASSSSLFPAGFNPWISNVTEDTSPHVTSERQIPDTALNPRFQSGPSAGNFLRKLCCGSKKWRWLHQWMIWNLRFLSKGLMVQTLSCSTRELLQHWTEPSRIPASRKGQSGGNESSQRRPFPSRQTDCLLVPRLLPCHWGQWSCRELCRSIYSRASKRQFSGVRFKMGRNFIVGDRNPNWWHLGKFVQKKNMQVWETQDRIGIVQYGDSSEESWTWLSQIEKLWWREVSSRKFEIRILGTELEILRRTPWPRIKGQNSVDKEVWEIVGIGKLTGSVQKETIAVSHTIWISVQNRHSRTLLQDLLRSRMWKMHREPRVLEAEAQVGKWLDCRARITSKELAPLHSVKNGILRSAWSTSLKRDADLWKNALMRIARLMNSLAKGLERMVTKVQWLYWRIHGNWVAYFKIWRRWSLYRFCGSAQTYGNQSDVFDSQKPWCVTLTFETKNHRLE